jgi:DNA-binding transcriptional LysR family regulator
VTAYPLYAERYILLTPKRGPFSGRKSVTWKEAAETPLCLLTPDMQNRRILNAVFASVGEAPNVHAETNSVMTLCSHIRTGAWSSVLPHNLLWLFGTPKGMLALPLVEPERHFTMGMVVRQQNPLPPLVEAFVKSVEGADLEAQIQPRKG